jgi:hypothetical protein
MIRIILASFIEDTLPLTSGGFFEDSQDKKTKILSGSLGDSYPHTLKEYLQKTTLSKLTHDLQRLLPFLKKEGAINSSIELLEILNIFLITEFAELVDVAPKTNLVTGEPKNALEKTINMLLKSFSKEELYLRISYYNSLFKNSSILRVQTPFSLEPEEKKAVRQELNKQFPRHLVSFSVEPALVGGMRIFKNGEMTDLSWRSKVKQFTFSHST